MRPLEQCCLTGLYYHGVTNVTIYHKGHCETLNAILICVHSAKIVKCLLGA